MSKFLSLASAILTFFSLISLLATVYLQQQTYKFIDSNRAIQNGLFVASDLSAITSLDLLWSWIDKIIESSAKATMDDIKANCYYSSNNQQTVPINGINYTIFDPRLQIQSCSKNIFYVQSNGLQRKVRINGNNQILSFGMFMKRSYPSESMRGAAGGKESSSVVIATEKTYQVPNVKYDPKFIEICSVKSQSPLRCVLDDGLRGQPGSTLHWTGKEIGKRMTFARNSRSYLYLKGHNNTLVPCYTAEASGSGVEVETPQRIYLNESDGTVSWGGNPSLFSASSVEEPLANCTIIWLTPGTTIRSKCLRVMNSQYSPRDSFLGAILGGQTVTSIYDHHFDCSQLIQYPLSQVKQWYYQSEDTIRVHITLPNRQKFYGNFFSASDEFIWLGEGISLSTLLQFHEYLDTNTRLFKIFLVIRNLGDTELFYSLVTITFTLSTTGSLTNSYSSIFIPIVQYDYGLDGYPWLFKDVAISELFLAVVLAMLIVKITRQLFVAVRDGVIPWVKQQMTTRQRRRQEGSGNGLLSFVESLWSSQRSVGRGYLGASGVLPVFAPEEETTSPAPASPTVGHESISDTREVELSRRPFTSLFPLVIDEKDDLPGHGVEVSVSLADSPSRNRNPLSPRASDSFSSSPSPRLREGDPSSSTSLVTLSSK
jgi:hypothetical protein